MYEERQAIPEVMVVKQPCAVAGKRDADFPDGQVKKVELIPLQVEIVHSQQ